MGSQSGQAGRALIASQFVSLLARQLREGKLLADAIRLVECDVRQKKGEAEGKRRQAPNVASLGRLLKNPGRPGAPARGRGVMKRRSVRLTSLPTFSG
jgi:hypothetical protein